MIVLALTIFVMAIMAATALIVLDETDMINQAKGTVSKQTYVQEFERLQSLKNRVIANNYGEITVEKYITELADSDVIEIGSEVTNADGSVSVTTKTGLIANLMQDGETNVIISLGSSKATVKLSQTSLTGDITSGLINKTLTVATTNVIGNIVWTTSNSNVVTVTGNNTEATVTLKGLGQATITASYGDVKAVCTVNVTGTVATPIITLDKTTISKTIKAGAITTETIVATTQNIYGSLVWSSTNPNIATISSSGNDAVITIKGVGTTTITASYGNVSASCVIVVTEKVPVKITFTIAGTTLQAEEEMTWGEWVASSYNTAGAVLKQSTALTNNNIVWIGAYRIVLSLTKTTSVKEQDIITAGYDYVKTNKPELADDPM